MAERFAKANRQMRREDNQQRAEEEQLLTRMRSEGFLPDPPTAPSLRSQVPTMRRDQQERAEAKAARPVQGSELDDLKGEVQHLKALLHAQGIRSY